MDDQLAPAVLDRLAVDVNLVSLAEVGVGPCFEMGVERVVFRNAGEVKTMTPAELLPESFEL